MNALATNADGVPEAVTAVIMVGDEVLMLHRHPALGAFAGADAFPGGQVDAADAAAPALPGKFAARLQGRRINALARELKEECDIDLPALAHARQIEELREVGYALTPPTESRRFSTWFYRVRLSTRPEVRLNRAEHTRFGWATPRHWLDQYRQGELLLVSPTLCTLEDLDADPTASRLERLAAMDTPQSGRKLHESCPINGITILRVRSHTLPPARYTNAFLIGDGNGAPRLLVDPAPWSDEELGHLCAQVDGRFDAIFITHHHHDHHERADRIARRFGVAMWMSADTHQRIAASEPDFFDGVPAVRECADGEAVTRWLGHEVRVLAVPGHDAGQLALLPDNRAWCLVGDLIQGTGTVVIAPPAGDMAVYFATLEKVIALQPRVIFPSHGRALGGTYYLEAALEHRRQREQQIRELLGRGASEDAMLAAIYAGLPEPLLPYARMNIRSHLSKLRAEQASDTRVRRRDSV